MTFTNRPTNANSYPTRAAAVLAASVLRASGVEAVVVPGTCAQPLKTPTTATCFKLRIVR